MAVMSKSQELMTTILKSLPAEAEITRIEYEGPRIAIYTKNYEFLTTNNYIIYRRALMTVEPKKH